MTQCTGSPSARVLLTGHLESSHKLRSGLKLLIDGDPCAIIENEFVKPGKGQAFNRVKIRNLKTGRVVDRTYKSGESVEAADVVEYEMQYLYSDGDQWHFMDPSSYEQYAAGESAVAGLAAALVARRDASLAQALGLDESSRVFVIGTEGATDPELYQQLLSN